MQRFDVRLLVSFFVSVVLFPLLQQDGQPPNSASPSAKLRVAAVVDTHSISVARVHRHLSKTLNKRTIPVDFKERAQSEALEHLIKRHLVLTGIKQRGTEVGPAQIKVELSKLVDRLREVEQTLPEYLAAQELTQAELEYEFRWRIAWKTYLAKHLTDERLTQYFQRHHRKFDGTTMKVAHLLLPLSDSENADLLKAKEIREAINAGDVGWAEAVKTHSVASSSSESGGEIGWVGYTGPMPANFCRAALALERDEISLPVKTAFGVHLIKCLQIKPGKVGPRDAINEVREDASRYLFDKLAEENRAAATIEYNVPWGLDVRR